MQVCDNRKVKRFHIPTREQIKLTNVLYALSDPVRLCIVKRLSECCEMSCGSIEVPVAKSTLTHHFKVLRETGIINARAEGTQYFNALRRDDLDARFPGLLDSILKIEDLD